MRVIAIKVRAASGSVVSAWTDAPLWRGDREWGCTMPDTRSTGESHVLTVNLAETAESAFAVDPQCRIVYWNAGAESLFGCSAVEALGRPCSEVLDLHDAGVPSVCSTCAKSIARPQGDALSRQFEGYAADVAGHLKHLRVVAIRSRNASGEPRVMHLLRELDSTGKSDSSRAPTGWAAGDPMDETAEPVVSVPDPHLTDRELGVLRLLASGLSTKEIADALGISRITARNHVTRTIEKLEVKSRLQAVIAAGRRGLL